MLTRPGLRGHLQKAHNWEGGSGSRAQHPPACQRLQDGLGSALKTESPSFGVPSWPCLSQEESGKDCGEKAPASAGLGGPWGPVALPPHPPSDLLLAFGGQVQRTLNEGLEDSPTLHEGWGVVTDGAGGCGDSMVWPPASGAASANGTDRQVPSPVQRLLVFVCGSPPPPPSPILLLLPGKVFLFQKSPGLLCGPSGILQC